MGTEPHNSAAPPVSRTRGRHGAFSSYSRKADAPLARALDEALERFGKPWTRTRARVFRNDADVLPQAALRSERMALFERKFVD